MSRLENLLKTLSPEQIAEREQISKDVSFFGILANSEYLSFSFDDIDNCYREILSASMKVLILRLFHTSGHLSDFNFEEMCSFFMMPILKNETHVKQQIYYIFDPNSEQTLFNLSTEELIEFVLDFARRIGSVLFYTFLKELCLCTEKSIARATYTYFILNKENYIKFVTRLYEENPSDYTDKILKEYLKLDLISYHHQHHV